MSPRSASPLHVAAAVAAAASFGCEREHKMGLVTLDPDYQGFRVEAYDKDSVQPGTVFFSDASNPKSPRIVEVDRDGRVVWQYRVPSTLIDSNAIMDSTPSMAGGALFVSDAFGVFETNRAGDVTRSYEGMLPSHDVDQLDDGSWLVTNGWAAKGEPHFMEIDPDSGSIGWKWTGEAHYDLEPYSEIYREGWIHANSAQRLDDGTTLVSLRNFNTVALLDSNGSPLWEITFNEVEPEAWAAGEFDVYPGRNPHEAEYTVDGTLLVALHSPSSVVEVDIDSQQVLWVWTPTTDGAGKIRDANRLPNGNTLVTSTAGIFEVNPAGEVVWRLYANYESDPNSPVEVRPFYKAVLIAPDGVQYGD